MSRTHRLRVQLLVACVVSCAALNLTPAVRAQEQDKAFKDGIDARDSKKWREAAEHMRQAIQADPQESARKVRTSIFGSTEYLPHFFLGEALLNLGECAAALDAWTISEQQGAVNARAESVAVVQKGYALCESKGVLAPARYAPLLGRTRQQVTEVTALGTAVFAAAREHNDLWTGAMRDQYDRANGELQNAQGRLANGTRTRLERDFSDASAAAERARTGFKAVQSELSSVVARSGAVQGIMRETEQALEAADAIARTLTAKNPFMTPPLLFATQVAHETAARGRSQMTVGQRTLNEPAAIEGRALAQDALGKYRAVLDAVTKRETAVVGEAVAQAEEAFSFLDRGFASFDRLAAERPDRVKPEMILERDTLQKAAAQAQRRLESARRSREIARLQEARGLAVAIRTPLDALIGAFGPVTLIDRGVRAALVDGARQFFAGEYAQALTTLDPTTLGDGPLQLHAHVLRAAAYYALFVRSGEKDDSQRTQAAAEVEKAKQISPDFSPDPRAFAPRFIAFFLTGVPAATQAPPLPQR
jgi:tetratricopeptide (TPR) repeat protein